MLAQLIKAVYKLCYITLPFCLARYIYIYIRSTCYNKITKRRLKFDTCKSNYSINVTTISRQETNLYLPFICKPCHIIAFPYWLSVWRFILSTGITRVLYSQQCNGKTSLNKPSVFDKQARFAFTNIFTYLSLLLFRLHCHSPSG